MKLGNVVKKLFLYTVQQRWPPDIYRIYAERWINYVFSLGGYVHDVHFAIIDNRTCDVYYMSGR